MRIGFFDSGTFIKSRFFLKPLLFASSILLFEIRFEIKKWEKVNVEYYNSDFDNNL
jgi:hypothetical protein